MTWSRLDDGWTDWPALAALTYESRWHYLSMIQFCSRTGRYDGMVRAGDALRCSDVPDPRRCIDELVLHELLVTRDVTYQVTHIDDHVPPPHLRDEKRRKDAAERQRRSRLHRKGDHTYCTHPPEPGTRDVTRDVGTGRDGTGRAVMEPVINSNECDDNWPPVRSVPATRDDDEQRAGGMRKVLERIEQRKVLGGVRR